MNAIDICHAFEGSSARSMKEQSTKKIAFSFSRAYVVHAHDNMMRRNSKVEFIFPGVLNFVVCAWFPLTFRLVPREIIQVVDLPNAASIHESFISSEPT